MRCPNVFSCLGCKLRRNSQGECAPFYRNILCQDCIEVYSKVSWNCRKCPNHNWMC